MTSVILNNANGKKVTIRNPDSNMNDIVIDGSAITRYVEIAADLASIDSTAKTVIVRDKDRGGVFNAITSTTANEGTIFNGNGCSWERQYSGAVNVKWFGAKGDGVADDTVAIQNAINTGKDLIIDKYIYSITQPLYITNNNQTIYVCGTFLISISKWLIIDGVSNIKFISNNGEIKFNSTVTDNRAGGIGAGIHITNSNNIEVSGFKVTTLTSDRTKTSFVIGTKSSTSCIIKNNNLIDIGIGIILGWTDDTQQVDINNIPTSKWIVSENTFTNCGRSGYANIAVRSKNNSFSRDDVYAITSHKITKNTIKTLGGSTTTGVGIEYWSNGGYILENTITGNSVDTYSHIAISCAKAYDGVISKNKIDGLWNYQGIELATCNNCIVSENTFYGFTNSSANCASIGVSVAVVGDPISSSNIIIGNTFIKCKVGVITGGSASTYSDNTTISSNSFIEGIGRQIYNLGTNTNIIGNTINGDTPIEILYGTANISSNNISSIGSFGIYIQSTAGLITVKNNSFNGWGTTGQNACIYFANSTTGHVIGNTFTTDGRSQSGWLFPMVALVKATSSPSVDTSHFVSNNIFIGVISQLSSSIGSYGSINTGTGRAYSSDIIYGSGTQNKVIFGGSVPTTGTWGIGDRALNTTPTAGGYLGWICTASGTPGTWKTFGAISA